MVRRYRATDMAQTTLNGSVTASDTTWPVADGSVFPSEGDYFLVCEDEIVLVTARSTNNLTVVRAQSGTANSSHSSGKTIRAVVTKEDIEGRLLENDILRAAPYGRIVDATGNVLTASDFSIISSATGSAITDDQDGVIRFDLRAHTGDDLSGCVRAFAEDVDFDVYAHMSCPWWDTDPWGTGTPATSFGLWIHQPVGGQMRGIALYPGKTIQAQFRATFLSNPTSNVIHGAEGRYNAWMKISMRWNTSGAGDDLTLYYSFDSFNWVQIYNENFACNGLNVGLWANNRGQAGWPIFLDYWYEDNTV